MTITINLFWAVLGVIILHTITTHLINWMWRSTDGTESEEVLFSTLTTIIEILVVIIAIYYITKT
jgi:hypothetical protein